MLNVLNIGADDGRKTANGMVMRMNNKEVVAYAVDANTGHITWWLYGERKDNG